MQSVEVHGKTGGHQKKYVEVLQVVFDCVLMLDFTFHIVHMLSNFRSVVFPLDV